ncbi:MAG TPA: glycosyltransferase family 4 protein, partial [Candidatus Acidoferrum sp.]|nr:glycosyltransferase family 4 protein [Candidatus Acidoferrum sp.]
LIREIRSFHADVIHAHLPGANLYACLAGAATGIPVVATYHGELFLPGSPDRHVGVKHWLVRKLASRIVLVADYLRNDFVNIAHFPPSKLSVIYNGIPVGEPDSIFDPIAKRHSVGLGPDDLVAGIVANFRPPKGYQYFAEAARLVRRELPNAKFLVIGQGEGEIKQKFETSIADFGLKENVKLLGFRSDVPELLRTMDLFVLSSISEGLPLAAVEAMAACRPVVATNVGGLSELVQDGRSGYLVPPADTNSLANRMIELLKDQSLRAHMGKAGREIATTTFSLETMVSSYQQLYEGLIT